MSPKTSALLGLAIFAFGCFIGNKFHVEPPPAQMSQEQNQQQGQKQAQESTQDCQVEVGKKTNPDGSIEDFFRFRASQALAQAASSDQSQAQKQEIKPPEPGIDIFAGGGAGSGFKGFGSVEAIAGRHSFEYLTNGPEWVALYKIKVISF